MEGSESLGLCFWENLDNGFWYRWDERTWGEVLLTVKLLAGEEYHSDYRAAWESLGVFPQEVMLWWERNILIVTELVDGITGKEVILVFFGNFSLNTGFILMKASIQFVANWDKWSLLRGKWAKGRRAMAYGAIFALLSRLPFPGLLNESQVILKFLLLRVSP